MEEKLKKVTSWVLVAGLTMVLMPGAVQAAAPSTDTIPPCEDILDPCRITGQTEVGGDCNGYADVNCTCDGNTSRCDKDEECTLYWHPVNKGCVIG